MAVYLALSYLQRNKKERGSPSIERRADGAVFYEFGHRKRWQEI
jgi:hypothetical protein